MMRAVIVDDEEPARAKLRRWLANERDIEIAGEFADGLGAAHAIITSSPDVVFLDVQMPGVNGLELQSRLVAGGRQVPIIFITAFNDENARAQALNAGALGYLVKPFEEPDLLNAINLALQRQENAPGSPRANH